MLSMTFSFCETMCINFGNQGKRSDHFYLNMRVGSSQDK